MRGDFHPPFGVGFFLLLLKNLLQKVPSQGLPPFLKHETTITCSEKPIRSVIFSRSTRASLLSSATETAASRLRRYTAEAYTSSREAEDAVHAHRATA